MEGAVVVLAGLAMFALAYRNLSVALLIAFFEALTFGHGRLFAVDVAGFSISLRMAIFGAIMAATVIAYARGNRPRFTADMWPLVLVVIALVVAQGVGFAAQPFGAALDDGNGYWSLAYVVPASMIVWGQEQKRRALVMFSASAAVLAGMTIAAWFAFTHLDAAGIGRLYTFVRDARLFEVTLLSGDAFAATLGTFDWYFRVFGPSQIVVPAWLLLFSALAFSSDKGLRVRTFAASVPMWAAFLMSGSRSFMLAFAVAAAAAFCVSVWRWGSVKKVATFTGLTAVAVTAALAVMWTLVVVPPRPDIRNSPFYRGDDGDIRNLAVSSRWNLLTPLLEEIAASPIAGQGFGASLTYISDDPRIRAINPDGRYTTYRFEWGVFDIWLKMGILGLLGFVWWTASLVRRGIALVIAGDEHAWLGVGVAAVVLFFFGVHVFTPFLNHPIGLTVFVLAHMLLPPVERERRTIEMPEMPKLVSPVPQPTVLTSQSE